VIGPSEPKRVLVIQLRRLGDVVLSTSLLDHLHQVYPAAALDFLVFPLAAPLLDHHALVSTRIICDRAHPATMWSLIRSRSYDWIIDVQSSPRTAAISLFSRAPMRVGWHVRGWWWVYTHTLPREGRPAEYVVRERQRLLELLGVPHVPVRTRLYLSAEELERGQSDAIALGITRGQPRVGLLLSAGTPVKQWTIGGYAELATRLASSGVAPVVFRGPGDDALVAELAARTRAAVIAPPLDLRRFLGLMKTCQAFVSGDTGPAHMAVALDVPAVTLFGSTNPVGWSAGAPASIVVRAEHVPCLGCHLDICPVGHECMEELTPATVFDAVQGVLDRRRPEASTGASPPLAPQRAT